MVPALSARSDTQGGDPPTRWEAPSLVPILTLILLLPLFLDSLRVAFGLRLMSFFAVSICLAIWLGISFAARKLLIPYSAVYVLLLLLMAISFLSITSPIGIPFVKLYRAVSFSYTRLLMVFLLVNLIRSREQVRRTMYVVIGLATFSALIALWQFWMYQQTGINYSFAEGEHLFRVTPWGTFLRASALASHPNEIGIVMAVAAVWCLYLGLSSEGVRPLTRAVHFLFFFILVGGVMATFSRNALFGLLIGLAMLCVTLAFVNRSAMTGGLAWAFGVLAVVAIGSVSIYPSMFHRISDDLLWRIELNQLGLRAVLENPITGVGVDAFANYDNAYELAVHNPFIQIAAEMGVLGLLLFVTLTGFVLVRLVKTAWGAGDPPTRSILVAMVLGYGTNLISLMGSPILTGVFFWFCVGLGEAAVVAHRAGVTAGHGVVKSGHQ